MPERILRPGPAAWILNVILCVALVILAVSALAAGAGFWLTFLFFLAAIAGLWMSWAVSGGRVAWLKLDEQGFTKRTYWRSYRYGWDEVSAFRVVDASPGVLGFRRKLVAFRLVDDEAPDLFRRITDPLDAARGFSHNYDMEPDHLADLLNDYRDAALMAQGLREASGKTAENSPQGAH